MIPADCDLPAPASSCLAVFKSADSDQEEPSQSSFAAEYGGAKPPAINPDVFELSMEVHYHQLLFVM